MQAPIGLDTAVIATWATVPPILRNLVRGSRRAATTAVSSGGDSLTQQLTSLTPAEQHQHLLTLVHTHAATVLGHSNTDAVDTERGFLDLGFDSLTAVEFRNRLNTATGLRLPTTLIFDYPTAGSLAKHLRAEIGVEGAETSLPVFGELEKLEAALSGAELAAESRTQLSKRLNALLWKLDDSGSAEIAEVDVESSGGAHLTSASDDEMFALIDKELGRN